MLEKESRSNDERVSFEKVEKYCVDDKSGAHLVEKLALHGLYLLIFELLKESMNNFFIDIYADADGYEKFDNKLEPVKYAYVNGDKVVIKLSDKKELSKHFKKLNKLFKGKELDEPKIMEQIDELVAKFEIFTREEGDLLKERYRSLRNKVGHSLFHMLLNDSFEEISVKDIIFIRKIYNKLDRWDSLVTMQIAYCDQELPAEEPEIAKSGKMVILDLAIDRITTYLSKNGVDSESNGRSEEES